MTAIVSKISKKELKESVMKGENFYIEDPAIINANSFFLLDMPVGTKVFVTNHPKRSYFAKIERNLNGQFKVS